MRLFRRDPSSSTGEDRPANPRDLAGRHLLLVPSTVRVDDVSVLLRARVAGSDLAGTGEVGLGRHSALTGPYELSMEDAVDAGVPMPWTVVYALDAPVEREDPPFPGADDRDGFAYAFPGGLPWREEGRGLQLLVSLARRLEGVVRVAGSMETIQPDPGRAVDFRIHTPHWLEPEVLEGIVARELPGARLMIETMKWQGPSPQVYSGEAIATETAHDPLSAEDLRVIHEAADDMDLAALAAGEAVDAYAVRGPAGHDRDGDLEVVAHVGEEDDPGAREEDWSSRPFVTYEVTWVSPDPAERERRTPSRTFLASRRRVAPLVRTVTRAIVEVTGGVVVDEDGFWVDRYQL